MEHCLTVSKLYVNMSFWTTFAFTIIQGVQKKPQHLIKWYLSVDIYAISYIGWYCRIGIAILHNHSKYHYQNRSDYLKIQLLLALLKNRFAQVLVEVR